MSGAVDELGLGAAVGERSGVGSQSGEIRQFGGVGVGWVVGDLIADGLDVGYVLMVEGVEGFGEELY